VTSLRFVGLTAGAGFKSVSELLEKKYAGRCPKPGTFLRNKETGDLAQVVEKDNDWFIKPDLPGSPVYYPASQAHRFNIEQTPKKLPPGSFARVAYEADLALCKIHTDLKPGKEWISLNPVHKAQWIEGNVKLDNPLRIRLYTAIIKCLEEYGE
jgi:hypothetical protein